MRTEAWRRCCLGGLLVLGLHGPVSATPPPEPPADAQAAHQVLQPEGLVARLLGDQPSPVRRYDPAIFTELLPVTAAEPPLRLPEDQRDAD